MTKQEALDLLKDRAFMRCAVDLCDMDCQDCYEALYMAIEALQQEPSCRNTRQVDLISRADLQELFNETTTSLMDKIEQKDIEHLVRACVMVTEMIQDAPSVVPKRGKWMDVEDQLGMQCSECGKMCSEITLRTDMMTKAHWNYCPNCGAKMEENTK